MKYNTEIMKNLSIISRKSFEISKYLDLGTQGYSNLLNISLTVKSMLIEMEEEHKHDKGLSNQLLNCRWLLQKACEKLHN